MKLVHLRHYHRKTVVVKHPLLDDAKVYSEEQLQQLEGDALCLALRSCLRHLIYRFVGNWGCTRPYVDDMVSEGMVAIVHLVNNLDILKGRPILNVASSRIQNRIEVMLNKMRSLRAPSCKKQWKQIAAGEPPIYMQTVPLEAAESAECADPTAMVDLKDLIASIPAKDELDAAILSSENWGQFEKDIATRFGVSKTTVHNRKQKLFLAYLKLKQGAQ